MRTQTVEWSMVLIYALLMAWFGFLVVRHEMTGAEATHVLLALLVASPVMGPAARSMLKAVMPPGSVLSIPPPPLPPSESPPSQRGKAMGLAGLLGKTSKLGTGLVNGRSFPGERAPKDPSSTSTGA